MTDTGEVFRRALEHGSTADVAAWTATGLTGLLSLRSYLSGELDFDPPIALHPIDEVDELGGLAAEAGARYPDEYLAVFADARWREDRTVLIGLGYVDRPEAARRLIAAADADHWGTRVAVAAGLRGHHSKESQTALMHLLKDDEYLVRVNALTSLVAVGTSYALAALHAHQADGHEEDLRTAAIEAIESRRGQLRSGRVHIVE